ncbi:hypothetical protein CCB81_01115 [Armatimonadetes bacterium Uphvl-Ar2]|jgi:CRP-like cAMP-binding protein|nr:hypothetical protein CCB81_01115 [Armatimonadetes bacterium Uphvl-Ar2]
MGLLENLRHSYLVEGLTNDEIAAVASVADEMSFAADEDIIREGELATEIYVLLEGKVRVTTSTGEIIARLGPGAVFGELALFQHDDRTATVTADTAAVLARASASSLNALIDSNPGAGVKVLRNLGKTLCQRLRSSNVQLEAVLASL